MEKKHYLWVPFAFSLLTQICGIAVLMFCFLSLSIPFDLVTLLVVYSMAILFQIIAITPYGIGSAEFVLTLTLSGFGIGVSRGLLLTLIFRFFNFWVPLFLGYITTKSLDFKNGKEVKGIS